VIFYPETRGLLVCGDNGHVGDGGETPKPIEDYLPRLGLKFVFANAELEWRCGPVAVVLFIKLNVAHARKNTSLAALVALRHYDIY
jgi:hypothetical protein